MRYPQTKSVAPMSHVRVLGAVDRDGVLVGRLVSALLSTLTIGLLLVLFPLLADVVFLTEQSHQRVLGSG